VSRGWSPVENYYSRQTTCRDPAPFVDPTPSVQYLQYCQPLPAPDVDANNQIRTPQAFAGPYEARISGTLIDTVLRNQRENAHWAVTAFPVLREGDSAGRSKAI
jgi:hypothetical protein